MQEEQGVLQCGRAGRQANAFHAACAHAVWPMAAHTSGPHTCRCRSFALTAYCFDSDASVLDILAMPAA